MPEPTDEIPLSPENRLRRVVILCVGFMRNLAYFRGAYEAPEGWDKNGGELVLPDASFWRTAANNALDMGVLEFCKLFADEKGKHFWKTVVSNPDGFKDDLLRKLGFTEEPYLLYLEEFKKYRDKFVAHLDDGKIMYIPQLDAAKIAVQHLHAWLIEKECRPGLLDWEHSTAERLLAGYEVEKAMAKRIYGQVHAIGERRHEGGAQNVGRMST
jgi:hypothetical protein